MLSEVFDAPIECLWVVCGSFVGRIVGGSAWGLRFICVELRRLLDACHTRDMPLPIPVRFGLYSCSL